MSESQHRTFVDLVLCGQALLEEIDDFVDQWHDGKFEGELNSYLGFRPEEYSLWVQEPAMLPHILHARRYGISTPKFVNDNFAELRLAARSTSVSEAAGLTRWLQQQGYLG